MKTSTFPSLRVDPALRKAAEDVLQEGETLSSFVEQSVRAQIGLRQQREEFIARGLASRDKAKKTGVYYEVTDVLKELGTMLAQAKAGAKAKQAK